MITIVRRTIPSHSKHVLARCLCADGGVMLTNFNCWHSPPGRPALTPVSSNLLTPSDILTVMQHYQQHPAFWPYKIQGLCHFSNLKRDRKALMLPKSPRASGKRILRRADSSFALSSCLKDPVSVPPKPDSGGFTVNWCDP